MSLCCHRELSCAALPREAQPLFPVGISVLVPPWAQLRLLALRVMVLCSALVPQHGAGMESPPLQGPDSHVMWHWGLGLGVAWAVVEEQLDLASEGFSNPNNSVIVLHCSPVSRVCSPEPPALLLWMLWMLCHSLAPCSCCSSLPHLSCWEEQAGSGGLTVALPGASTVSLPWSVCSWRTGGCARPTPTFTGAFSAFCPGSITSKGLDNGKQPVCNF